mgnify:CR=1 FL=1
MRLLSAAILALSAFSTPTPLLADGKPVPEIDFLTWPSAKYQHYYETSAYIAEAWEKLGIPVKLNPQPFPQPMLGMWFTEHKFDVVLSVLSGSPARLDPEFYAANQFWTNSSSPGGMNVGSFSSKKIDALIAVQRRLYDAEARRKVVYELQAAIQEEQPEGLIASVINTTAINTDNVELEGYENSPDGVRSIWNLMRITPKNGQKMVKLGWTIDQASWNPLTFKTLEELDRLGLVYDRLVVIGPDGQPKMWAATSFEVVDDTTIAVEIRDGLTFSDGKPLTAEDVAFSYQFLRDNNAIYFKNVLVSLKDVSVDGNKVRFSLSEPTATFIAAGFGQIPILPKHVWSTIVADKGLTAPQDYKNVEIVGSGPYRLKYWKEGQEIYFERNPDHFMAPPADLLMIQFGSAEVLAASLRKGEIDVSLQPLVPTVIEEFAAEDNLQLIQAQSNGYMSARYNTKTEFFSHKAVRQALAHAIPYEAIIEEVLGGDATATPSQIVPANAFWTNKDLKVPEYNLDKAREILKAAGFTWDDKGMLHFPE